MKVYQIFVDRFSTGKESLDLELSGKTGTGWLGGNLVGVLKKLEYIKSLGFDAIWLSPIFKSSVYNGYHVVDFFEIDPHFGNKEIFCEVVKSAHRFGIKVILDFVPNHVSKYHPFFREAQKNKNSEYFNWFIFKKWPNDYMCFLDVKDIPKINLENPDARNYILDAAEYWIENFQIDGYRIDHAIGPPFDFWKDFVRVCRKFDRKFLLLPEIWYSGVRMEHLETIWFLKENGEWKKILVRLLEERKKGNIWVWDQESRNTLAEEWTMKIFSKYFKSFLDFSSNFMLRMFAKKKEIGEIKFRKSNFHFLDNHDMQRIMWILKNDEKSFFELLELLTKAGNLIIYYGTEIGISQLKDFFEYGCYGNIEARRFMEWNKVKEKSEFVEKFKRVINAESES